MEGWQGKKAPKHVEREIREGKKKAAGDRRRGAGRHRVTGKMPNEKTERRHEGDDEDVDVRGRQGSHVQRKVGSGQTPDEN